MEYAADTVPRLTYVGHATVLIELDGVRLLADPVLRHRTAHLRRQVGPVDPAVYRNIDAVLISHLHHDHLDLPSLRRLVPARGTTRLLVPPGAAHALQRWGFPHAVELRAGEVVDVRGLVVQATPANHSGFRVPFGPAAGAIGFVIRGSRTVYFAGDTDLFPGMAELRGTLDAALLPVWGWWSTVRGRHMDPLRAATALTLLRPRVAVPIHWGTLCPIGMGWTYPRFLSQPPLDFRHHAADLAPEVQVRVLAPGERLLLTG